jgi:hypothetical protein
LVFTYFLFIADESFTYAGIPYCEQGIFCYINL